MTNDKIEHRLSLEFVVRVPQIIEPITTEDLAHSINIRRHQIEGLGGRTEYRLDHAAEVLHQSAARLVQENIEDIVGWREADRELSPAAVAAGVEAVVAPVFARDAVEVFGPDELRGFPPPPTDYETLLQKLHDAIVFLRAAQAEDADPYDREHVGEYRAKVERLIEEVRQLVDRVDEGNNAAGDGGTSAEEEPR